MSVSSRFSSKTRAVLVAAQLAFCVILLVGAGLTLRTVLHLERVDPGFQPSGVLTARMYSLSGTHQEFFKQLLERIRKLPGVESAGMASTIPLHNAAWDGTVPIEIRGDAKAIQRAETSPTPPVLRIVTPDYFRTLGARVMAGRDFDEQDANLALPVVVINQHLASHYWPNGNAVGKQIAVSPGHLPWG